MDEDDDAEMISDDEAEEIIDDDEDVDESDDDEEGGNREMTWHLEDITDQNEPIIRLHTEIDDDDHEHRHHHRRHADPFDEVCLVYRYSTLRFSKKKNYIYVY
jgi:E3 ubiquitin-protein ligase HUWE1